MFKAGDLVRHKKSGWLGFILWMTSSDIAIHLFYEPRAGKRVVIDKILLFPSQLEFLEKVL